MPMGLFESLFTTPAMQREKLREQQAAAITGIFDQMGQQQQSQAPLLSGPNAADFVPPAGGLMGQTQPQYGPEQIMQLYAQMAQDPATSEMGIEGVGALTRQEMANQGAMNRHRTASAQDYWQRQPGNLTGAQAANLAETQAEHRRQVTERAADNAFTWNNDMNKQIMAHRAVVDIGAPVLTKADQRPAGTALGEWINRADQLQLANAFQKSMLGNEAVMSDNILQIQRMGGALGMGENWLQQLVGGGTMGDTDIQILMDAIKRNLGGQRQSIDAAVDQRRKTFENQNMMGLFNPVQMRDPSMYAPGAAGQVTPAPQEVQDRLVPVP